MSDEDTNSKGTIEPTSRCDSVQVTPHGDGRDAVVFSLKQTELGTRCVHLRLSVVIVRAARISKRRPTLYSAPRASNWSLNQSRAFLSFSSAQRRVTPPGEGALH